MILSKDWFKINGVSSDTVGIYVDTPSVPPMAQQRYMQYTTGTDEDGTTPDDTYEDIEYVLTFYTFNRTDFDNSDIYAFLANAKTLEISRLNGFYFKVRQVYVDTPENVMKGEKIRYTITFILAPFKYFTSEEEITLKNGSIVTNYGTRYCKPTFYITTSDNGDVTIIVNGATFQLLNLVKGQTVTVDTSRYIAYVGNEILYNRTVGQFPFLASGDNYISWSGSVSSLKVLKNERNY